MKHKGIPDETIRRLPVYLRGLIFLQEGGQDRISSSKLGDFVGVQSWQIRKDFSYFGEFGVRGVGYEIKKLIDGIKEILKLNKVQNAALVGAGNLGSAILSYPGFELYGFNVTMAFDNNAKKIGKKIKSIEIMDVSKLDILKKKNVRLGIIAVPRSEAQEIANALVKAGVKGILNFSPCYIMVPKKVKVMTIDIAGYLARMPYYTLNG
ncbi:MAG: redox-sensing transcriptional repressor Rex [Sedimentisphaerales bacterium]|nr:redox-sensing transcriptional repressor Rex [Sedimentisphaerales bacterium]